MPKNRAIKQPGWHLPDAVLSRHGYATTYRLGTDGFVEFARFREKTVDSLLKYLHVEILPERLAPELPRNELLLEQNVDRFHHRHLLRYHHELRVHLQTGNEGLELQSESREVKVLAAVSLLA